MSEKISPDMTERYFFTKDKTFFECDKLTENNHVIKRNVEYNGMKVIIEFPKESADKTSIHEVKSILSDMLQEYLVKRNTKEEKEKAK